jgi:hypothetical protein
VSSGRSAENDVERRQVAFGKIGWEIDRAEAGRCRTKGDPGARGERDDAPWVVGVGDDGAAEPDLPTTAYGLAGDPDCAHIGCGVENVQRVGHRGGDDLAISPSAGLGSGNGERGRHESTTSIAHVGTQAHGVGIDLLVETSAEIPVGDESLGTHQVSEALPVLVGGSLSDVSDWRHVDALWFRYRPKRP